MRLQYSPKSPRYPKPIPRDNLQKIGRLNSWDAARSALIELRLELACHRLPTWMIPADRSADRAEHWRVKECHVDIPGNELIAYEASLIERALLGWPLS
ncbi:hypothetical protein FNV43_RR06002 [Rhamnella rubrinervis]|uniref:Uncharacterized protein n=1 Tax=Rhamnella rubrinervis TaxID=2594499 RepID=A0A8K0HDR2_9ROSA|nr:hypothetical protein FNV43_RR06002 [Rhamnella rubrinervis]